MTVDEELTVLEDNVRKLKVEYDVYFAGGLKKPPDDVEWRVRNAIKKYSDGRALSLQQQFRYNTIAQKFAVFSDLWRRKLKIKEEGYRRPQDALLAIQGLRPEEEHAAAEALGLVEKTGRRSQRQFEFAEPGAELDKAQVLYEELVDARRRAGVPLGPGFDSFREFLSKKTTEIRKQFGCASVQYSIELENGEVKLKARGKN
ncbi:MAG TPA: MXAN_5187 C-terminal domain-containing protein [Terriglobales bacterium]|nr:MXAN_5187 C-terminal domain-containing protein [Terriglobales bacterium]